MNKANFKWEIEGEHAVIVGSDSLGIAKVRFEEGFEKVSIRCKVTASNSLILCWETIEVHR